MTYEELQELNWRQIRGEAPDVEPTWEMVHLAISHGNQGGIVGRQLRSLLAVVTEHAEKAPRDIRLAARRVEAVLGRAGIELEVDDELGPPIDLETWDPRDDQSPGSEGPNGT